MLNIGSGTVRAALAVSMLLQSSVGRTAQADVSAPRASPATDLRQATERAILLLPDTAANQALREQAAAQRRAARGPFVGPPVVSGDLEIGGEGFSEQEVGVSAGFRWPGEGRAARRAADLGVDSIGAGLEEARLQVAGEVRAAWWALASAQATFEIEREQARLADQEIATVTRLVNAGVQARRDLLIAQAERSAADARLSNAESEVAAAQAAYEALAGPAPVQFPSEAPASRGTALDDHPAVRAALARAAAAEARATATAYGGRPRIEGRVGVRRERVDTRDGFENALLVGVGIPIGRNYGAVAESAGARSEALRARAEAARVRSRLVAERAAGDRRLVISRRVADEAQARRDALAQALALTERGRREGEIGYIEVLRARQALGQAARDAATARIAALAAISTFNQAQGVLP